VTGAGQLIARGPVLAALAFCVASPLLLPLLAPAPPSDSRRFFPL
jgi:hypothetical protein